LRCDPTNNTFSNVAPQSPLFNFYFLKNTSQDTKPKTFFENFDKRALFSEMTNPETEIEQHEQFKKL
jgi:hypothetical protein